MSGSGALSSLLGQVGTEQVLCSEASVLVLGSKVSSSRVTRSYSFVGLSSYA